MSENKLSNRPNLYFNKSQTDVLEYMSNIEDKSSFLASLVREKMYKEKFSVEDHVPVAKQDNYSNDDIELLKSDMQYVKLMLQNINNIMTIQQQQLFINQMVQPMNMTTMQVPQQQMQQTVEVDEDSIKLNKVDNYDPSDGF